MRRRTSLTVSTMARAFGVGCMPDLTRTNSGSSNALRIFSKAWLIAGWLSPSSRPAIVTLRYCIIASNTTSRFRSSLPKFIFRISTIRSR
ncbi:hypothetical protein D3C85_1746210 [compost metagenome]